MSLLRLHILGSPVLRRRSGEVAHVGDGTRKLVADMFETMAAAKGVGLAANQVGVAERVAVIDAEGRRFAMINPRIVESSAPEVGEEGCLSIPEFYGEVRRPSTVVLEAQDEHGAVFRLEASGLVARAIQHEIDHLDGILFVDHLSLLKRELLLKRWRREHRDEDGYIRDVATVAPERATAE